MSRMPCGTKAMSPIRSAPTIPIPASVHADGYRQTLDKGSAHFEPSTLAFTSVDVGNTATNVIPGEARAAFNIRFNDLHTADNLDAPDRR